MAHVTVPLAAAVLAAAPALAQGLDWKSEANARIEQLRKRDVEIVVADRTGATVPGAAVAAEQVRHAFAFGSALNTNALSNPDYAQFFVENFEWGVFENESKWFMNEPSRDFESYAEADALAAFARDHGILLRGHCLFWAKEEYTPPWCRSLPANELREEVDERIDHAVPHFRGTFLHWDVNNEMLDGSFFRQRLGPEIEPYMFRRTKELAPEVLTFVNDYSILAGSETRTAAYIRQVRDLEAGGGPVDRVGVQGHFWGSTVDPLQVLARLDQLSVLGKPVWVTEYDTVDPDPAGRADKLENLYRAAFSHPVVEGILMWGFWAGSHWRGADAAIVDLDWTVNAAGLRYQSLIAEWTTRAAGATGGDGSFRYRGFQGTYDVRVDSGTTTRYETFDAPPGEGPAAFLVPLKAGACFAAREVAGVRAARDGSGGLLLSWDMVPWRSDFETGYDVLRATEPAFAAASCLESDDRADRRAGDPEAPAPGSAFYYLVRGRYACAHGEGTLGTRSDGTPRTGPGCP